MKYNNTYNNCEINKNKIQYPVLKTNKENESSSKR